MPTRIALLTIGSEILDGRIQDTNSQYLVQQLSGCGYEVTQIHSCGDDLREIVEALEFLGNRVGFIIATGGLGPTDDDLTREAVSRFTSAALEEQADLIEKLRERFAKRGVPFDPSNVKQAMLPAGAERIPNSTGSATGFIAKAERPKPHFILCLPGVPSELYAMFDQTVLPFLKRTHDPVAPRSESWIRVFGLTESELGGIVERAGLPPEVAVAYQTCFPENRLILRGTNPQVAQSAALLHEKIGASVIYSTSADEDLPAVVHRLLNERGATLALAESCTGGLIAKSLTDRAGSSSYFLGGVVSYNNKAKQELLGVTAAALESAGAVSYITARQMAEGAKSRFHAAHALSVTGIAGPEGGTPDKPVGLFYLGYAGSEVGSARAYRCHYPGPRERIRAFAQWMALDLLRRILLDLPPHGLLEPEHTAGS